MDILQLCPITKPIINILQTSIHSSTRELNQQRKLTNSFFNNDTNQIKTVNLNNNEINDTNNDIEVQNISNTTSKHVIEPVETLSNQLIPFLTDNKYTTTVAINHINFETASNHHRNLGTQPDTDAQTNCNITKTNLESRNHSITTAQSDTDKPVGCNKNTAINNFNESNKSNQQIITSKNTTQQIILEKIDQISTKPPCDSVTIVEKNKYSMALQVYKAYQPMRITIEKAIEIIYTLLLSISISTIKHLTTTTAYTYKIKMKPNAKVINRQVKSIPPGFEKDFRNLLTEMYEAGIIRNSFSNWSSPIRLLRKKDGAIRFTVNYQALNQHIEKDAYPLPLANDIFNRLAHAKYFTVIDLTSGYFQVPLAEESRKYTAFKIPGKFYEFCVLPMGITGACEGFQRMMNEIFEGLLHNIMEVYLDDIIIFSKTLEEHIHHVQLVIERLRKYNLKIKISKCTIAVESIEYLSHIISHGTIKPSNRKVQDLMKYKAPLTPQQVYSFIGLGSYYRRFICNFSKIVSPLLRYAQGEIQWTNECLIAFETIRTKLTSAPILVLPKFEKPFQLETDACNYGIGAVLSQEAEQSVQWLPVAYYSKHLTKQQRNYSVSEKELLAIVLGVEHFRQFLYGINFNVITDHQPLKYLLTIKEPSSRLIRWVNRLNMYQFTIVYRKGSKNGNADALSRLCTENEEDENDEDDVPHVINLLISKVPELNSTQLQDKDLEWFFDLKLQAERENKHIIPVKKFDNSEQRSLYAQWSRIFILNNTLYRTYTSDEDKTHTLILQYVVPKQQRNTILYAAHDPPESAHQGINKTIERIRERFYWPAWTKDIETYIKTCTICQKVKDVKYNTDAPLTPIVTTYPFQIINADIMGPINPISTAQNKYVLVVIDHFTKYVLLFPMRNIKAIDVLRRLKTVVCQHGIPDQILTDQGSNFQSDLLDQFYELFDIHKTRTTPFYPQCDGQAERFMSTLKAMIRAYIQPNQKNWDEHLELFQLAYNTAEQATTGYSPFYLMYGRNAKMPIDFLNQQPNTNFIANQLEYIQNIEHRLNQAYTRVSENTNFKMNKHKLRHDRRVRPERFEIGEFVWVTIEAVKPGVNKAIFPRWKGPYKVIDSFGDSSYILERIGIKNIKKDEKTTCTIHKSRLKRAFIRTKQMLQHKEIKSSEHIPVTAQSSDNVQSLLDPKQQSTSLPSESEPLTSHLITSLAQNHAELGSEFVPINSQNWYNTIRRSTRLRKINKTA